MTRIQRFGSKPAGKTLLGRHIRGIFIRKLILEKNNGGSELDSFGWCSMLAA